MDEELRQISARRHRKDQDVLSREMSRYDDSLYLRNQDTAATLTLDRDILGSTAIAKRLKNLDRDYEISNRRPT